MVFSQCCWAAATVPAVLVERRDPAREGDSDGTAVGFVESERSNLQRADGASADSGPALASLDTNTYQPQLWRTDSLCSYSE